MPKALMSRHSLPEAIIEPSADFNATPEDLRTVRRVSGEHLTELCSFIEEALIEA
jgi:hypothetical protein